MPIDLKLLNQSYEYFEEKIGKILHCVNTYIHKWLTSYVVKDDVIFQSHTYSPWTLKKKGALGKKEK